MSSSNEIASYLLLLNIYEIWSRDTWMNFESPGVRIFKIGAPQQKIRSTEVKVHQNDKNAKYRKNAWIMKIYRFQILIWCKKHRSQSRVESKLIASFVKVQKLYNFTLRWYWSRTRSVTAILEKTDTIVNKSSDESFLIKPINNV